MAAQHQATQREGRPAQGRHNKRHHCSINERSVSQIFQSGMFVLKKHYGEEFS